MLQGQPFKFFCLPCLLWKSKESKGFYLKTCLDVFSYLISSTLQMSCYSYYLRSHSRAMGNDCTSDEYVFCDCYSMWVVDSIPHHQLLDDFKCLPVIVTGMLILGGAAVVNALSGMDIYAASFLIPLAAAPFTMSGVIGMLSQSIWLSFWSVQGVQVG